jgi:integrase family protein
VTRTGKPISRTNIWREMKALCVEADVNPQKVFPHNLRHLFARVFYGIEKDIAKLADILGHSSINTTRIYNLHRHGTPPAYGEYAPDPMKKSHPFGGGYIIYIMLHSVSSQEIFLTMCYVANPQNGAKIQVFSIFALKSLSFAVFR